MLTVGEPHMHGGDEHQSMPQEHNPRGYLRGYFQHEFDLQINAAELSPSLMESIPFDICAIQRANESIMIAPLHPSDKCSLFLRGSGAFIKVRAWLMN